MCPRCADTGTSLYLMGTSALGLCSGITDGLHGQASNILTLPILFKVTKDVGFVLDPTILIIHSSVDGL